MNKYLKTNSKVQRKQNKKIHNFKLTKNMNHSARPKRHDHNH